jgi:hypothetical protein
MPHATPVVQDLEKSKVIARAIQKRFDELNSPIKLNHAYEALAIAHRHPNWATMKAAIDAPSKVSETPGAGAFVLGQRVVRYDAENGPEDIELPHADALKHIHCFSTSIEARRAFLMEVGANAIHQGSTAIFIEPVSDEASKSLFLNSIMDCATRYGRRRDFFALDLSDARSRIGNSCNILEDEVSPENCANLLLSDYSTYQNWFDAHRIICECARRILEKGFNLDAEGISTELRKFNAEGVPEEWRELYGAHYPASILGLAGVLAVHVDRFAKKYRKFFDRNSPWPGFRSVLNRPQILVIFVPSVPGDVEDALHPVAFDALRKAMRTERKTGTPGMLLVNDVDIFGSHGDIADLATSSRVCMTLADQCPTLPYQFDDEAVEIRSRFLEGDKSLFHYLIDGAEEIRMWPGLRSASLKPSTTGKFVRRGGVVRRVS